MTREIELDALDLRYESYRMKNPVAAARLLAAIAERGIEEPLEGVDRAPLSILLNGFKRYRCAVKLGMGLAPYASLGAEEAAAILNLLRVSNDHSLSILEQAAFPTAQARAKQRGRAGRTVIAEQVLGEHAARAARRDEPAGAGEDLQRRFPALSLHVHAAAVHAHERAREAGGRGVRPGLEREEAQCARD